jgi:hypothetical protein
MVWFYWSINVVPVEIKRNISTKIEWNPFCFMHNENPNAFCSVWFYWAWPGLAFWPTTNLSGTTVPSLATSTTDCLPLLFSCDAPFLLGGAHAGPVQMDTLILFKDCTTRSEQKGKRCTSSTQGSTKRALMWHIAVKLGKLLEGTNPTNLGHIKGCWQPIHNI